jgi:hypothetical protein
VSASGHEEGKYEDRESSAAAWPKADGGVGPPGADAIVEAVESASFSVPSLTAHRIRLTSRVETNQNT